MTDQKIIRAVAEKVMGWFYLPPHQENVGEWGVLHIFEAEWKTEDGRHVFYEREWNPLTNPAHWMLVVERMRELGWRCKIESFPDNWGATFFKDRISVDAMSDIHEEYYEFNTNLGHAICETSIKALENKRNG